MTQRGFTLVELMVVVALIMLLLTWGIPAFSTWNARHNVEGEIARLYGDLQFARMTAYANKNVTGIYWGGTASITQYSIMTAGAAGEPPTIDNGATPLGAAVSTGANPLIVTCTTSTNLGVTPVEGQQSVSFDGRGLLYTDCTTDPASQVIFYITPNYGAGTNCVSVSLTSIVSGKWDGTKCGPK